MLEHYVNPAAADNMTRNVACGTTAWVPRAQGGVRATQTIYTRIWDKAARMEVLTTGFGPFK